MSPISEEDMAGWKRVRREERLRERLFALPRRGPDAPDPCEECDGQGHISVIAVPPEQECPRCQGTGVQP